MEAPVAWILQKDSPYTEVFNYYLLEFIEKGQWSSIQKKYMAGPQVCPDFSAQPIGFESACTPFLIFIFAIILTFGLLIFEILNEKRFSNRISSTKKASRGLLPSTSPLLYSQTIHVIVMIYSNEL